MSKSSEQSESPARTELPAKLSERKNGAAHIMQRQRLRDGRDDRRFSGIATDCEIAF